MADASDSRPGVGQGTASGSVPAGQASSEAVPPVNQSLADQLRLEIAKARQTAYGLAKITGLGVSNLTRFISRERGLTLEAAGRVASALGLKLGPGVVVGHSLADQLRNAITGTGETAYSLAKRSGLGASNVSRFMSGERDFNLESGGRATSALGLKLVPAPGRATHARAKPRVVRPKKVSRLRPVELRGEGLAIQVYGEEVPPMTGIAYKLVEFAVERFDQGGGCTGREMAARTGSDRPIRLLILKLKQPPFAALARVLRWDATKGGILRMIDPGPPIIVDNG